MKPRILFIIKYFAFWVCAFVLAKLAFLIYLYPQSFSLSPLTWVNIFTHGVRLDLSAAGYFTLLPALVLLATSFMKGKTAYYIINIYSLVMLVVFLLLTLVDMEIYKYWGARLDSAPLRFLGKPKETLASSSIVTLIIYTVSFVGLTGFFYLFYKKYLAATLINTCKAGIPGVLGLLILTGVLLLPIRGGLGVSPINTGTVYFSKNVFANHAAINVIWNFGHSLLEGRESKNPYTFYKTDEYEKDLDRLFEETQNPVSILNNKKPNIILIVMESFSAKVIEPLGGTPGITPQFNELSREGVLFSNIYSTDSRTDKGLATIISGYPVLEAIPILRYPDKTQHLPFLSMSLRETGYHSTFLYGGDVDFANIRSYLINGGFAEITSVGDFRPSLRTGKWGVPDHYVFDTFIEDIKADTGSWFKVMLTLSNHEPFEIPTSPKFGERNLTERFYSSAYYADSCLGNFIRQLKQSGLWNNTLVILVADHGTRLPDFDDIFEPRKHHIPLLFTGGAVARDTVVTKTGSQADIAITLLRQLGLPTGNYFLGKDLLSADSRSFAFYSIKNGIAMLTDSSGFGFDFISNDFNYTHGKVDSSQVKIAKAMQQHVFENYLNLSR